MYSKSKQQKIEHKEDHKGYNLADDWQEWLFPPKQGKLIIEYRELGTRVCPEKVGKHPSPLEAAATLI